MRCSSREQHCEITPACDHSTEECYLNFRLGGMSLFKVLKIKANKINFSLNFYK